MALSHHVSLCLHYLWRYGLTVKGSRGSKHDLYTQSLQASPSLKIIFFYSYGFETSFITLSYVKEKIKIDLSVTLMIIIQSMYMHPRALMPYI